MNRNRPLILMPLPIAPATVGAALARAPRTVRIDRDDEAEWDGTDPPPPPVAAVLAMVAATCGFWGLIAEIVHRL